ncbi:L-asparaginase [Aspergillus campestris IBT 28561]|uniref:asparaginase n=1 Tax=Aspergillus campestris (strain IBT 28561) TaxID=1392248 RepID=A0A2I1CS25_ASPC2|nr:L-asparaginase [Aspergillus campestris IBT 28561]PKY00418.1 L-asparaginase [Aspergillus campestris IBT 28561]
MNVTCNTTFLNFDPKLPNITIFATGGTIAGNGSSNTNYTSGVFSVEDLIYAVPSIKNISNVVGDQVSNVGSEDVNSTILLDLSKKINQCVCEDDAMSGAVVTHGTDTLEETAFFLDATLNCSKPVVIVGAMRPASAISADGPYNLIESVTVAVSKDARNRGALVVMNDRIVSTYYVTKTNANTMDTFKAVEMGNVGQVIGGTPYFFFPPTLPTGRSTYNISEINSIPRVDILYSYQDMQNETIYDTVNRGAKGIVIAGAGAGGVSTRFNDAIEDVVNNYSIPVVQSFRTGSGEVPYAEIASTSSTHIASGYLNPQKSRILLGLLLAEKKSLTEIAGAFAKGTAG